MIERATGLEDMGFALALQRARRVEIAAERHILAERGKGAAARQYKAGSGQTKQGCAAIQRIIGVERQPRLWAERSAPCAIDFEPFGAGQQRAGIADVAIVQPVGGAYKLRQCRVGNANRNASLCDRRTCRSAQRWRYHAIQAKAADITATGQQ